MCSDFIEVLPEDGGCGWILQQVPDAKKEKPADFIPPRAVSTAPRVPSRSTGSHQLRALGTMYQYLPRTKHGEIVSMDEKVIKKVVETAVIGSGAGRVCDYHPEVIITNRDPDAKTRSDAEGRAYAMATEHLKRIGCYPNQDVMDAVKALLGGADKCPQCPQHQDI